MQKLFTAFFLFVSLFTSVHAQQWTYKGLGGIITNQLTIDNDTIFASTSDGLYKKHMYSTDTNWQQVSLGGKWVLNTLFLDANECLMFVAANTGFPRRAVLYKSPDRGKTVSLFLPDTTYYNYPNLAQIAKSPFSKDSIYLLRHGKKTYDGGQTWLPIAPAGQVVWGNFIYVNPANSKELFCGGESLIFAASLLHSSDNAQSWVLEDCNTVFAGDNALEVFHVIDDYWYASGEGIVVRKHKDSTNWTQLLNVFHNQRWALYMFGFDVSPANSDYLYVSGLNSAPQLSDSLRLLKSSDRGATWDSLTFAIPQQTKYAVQDLKVQHVWGEDRVWMGGNGVFTFAQGIISVVDDKKANDFKVMLYPNPVADELVVKIKGINSSDKVEWSMVNTMGQMIYQGEVVANENIVVPVDGLHSGIYFICVSIYDKQEVVRFIKQ